MQGHPTTSLVIISKILIKTPIHNPMETIQADIKTEVTVKDKADRVRDIDKVDMENTATITTITMATLRTTATAVTELETIGEVDKAIEDKKELLQLWKQ